MSFPDIVSDLRSVMPQLRGRLLANHVAGLARSGDYVVCLGAGSITQWAYALPGELEAVGGKA